MKTQSVRVFDNIRYLRITKTSVRGVFVIRDAWLPWHSRASDVEKKVLLHRLYGSSGSCVAWLDSRIEYLASSATSVSDRLLGLSNSDWCGWFELDEALLQALVSCQEGGWGCFFFAPTFGRTLHPVSPLPTAPETFMQLLESLDAEAAVVSDIDDAYWLIGFKRDLPVLNNRGQPMVKPL